MGTQNARYWVWYAIVVVGGVGAIVIWDQSGETPLGMLHWLEIACCALTLIALMTSRAVLLQLLRPELQHCDSYDAVSDIVNQAFRFRGRWLWAVLAFIIALAVTVIIMRLLAMLGLMSVPFIASIVEQTWFLFPLYGWALVYCVLIRQRIARRIRYLVNRSYDQSMCLYCGYDLRGTPDRCPECGHDPADPPREVADLIV